MEFLIESPSIDLYYVQNLYYDFHDSGECLDFLNTLFLTSDFPTRCWEKSSLSHGWRIDDGHVCNQHINQSI